TRSHAAARRGGTFRDRETVGERLSPNGSRPRSWAVTIVENAVQRGRRNFEDARHYSGRRFLCPPHRLRQRQQPASRAITLTQARNDDAACARRGPPPFDQATFHRRLAPFVNRRARRNRGRLLEPQRARACVSAIGAGDHIDYPGQLDWRVLLLSVAICIGSTMFFALMPAIQASHVDLSGALKSEGAGVVGGSGRSRLRSALVLVQVSLSFVLLAGTGLLLQSLQRMQNTSPGFF